MSLKGILTNLIYIRCICFPHLWTVKQMFSYQRIPSFPIGEWTSVLQLTVKNECPKSLRNAKKLSTRTDLTNSTSSLLGSRTLVIGRLTPMLLSSLCIWFEIFTPWFCFFYFHVMFWHSVILFVIQTLWGVFKNIFLSHIFKEEGEHCFITAR